MQPAGLLPRAIESKTREGRYLPQQQRGLSVGAEEGTTAPPICRVRGGLRPFPYVLPPRPLQGPQTLSPPSRERNGGLRSYLTVKSAAFVWLRNFSEPRILC